MISSDLALNNSTCRSKVSLELDFELQFGGLKLGIKLSCWGSNLLDFAVVWLQKEVGLVSGYDQSLYFMGSTSPEGGQFWVELII